MGAERRARAPAPADHQGSLAKGHVQFIPIKPLDSRVRCPPIPPDRAIDINREYNMVTKI